MDFIHFHSEMRKMNGFSHPFRWRKLPHAFHEAVKRWKCYIATDSLVGSLGPFWIIDSEGVFCGTRKLKSLEPKWPLFWLEKALFWLIDLQKQRSLGFQVIEVRKCWCVSVRGVQKNNVYIIHLDLFLDFRLLVSSISPFALQVKPTIKRIAPQNCSSNKSLPGDSSRALFIP